MSPRSCIVYTDKISKTAGKISYLKNVSLAIMPGESVGIVGPVDSGKSSLLSILMGYARPSGGEIQLFGKKIKPQTAHQVHQQIGYSAGHTTLLDNLTGKQYLKYMASLTRSSTSQQKQLIELFDPQMNTPIKRLTPLDRQKISLIASLQHQPKFLILDEPTAELDSATRKIFFDLVRGQNKDGTTLLIASRELSEIAPICDRVIFINQGKIFYDGTTKEIEKRSGKEVTVTADKPTLLKLARSRPAGIAKPKTNEDGSITFLYKGTSPRLLKWLASHKINNIDISEHSFDDIFDEVFQTEVSS